MSEKYLIFGGEIYRVVEPTKVCVEKTSTCLCGEAKKSPVKTILDGVIDLINDILGETNSSVCTNKVGRDFFSNVSSFEGAMDRVSELFQPKTPIVSREERERMERERLFKMLDKSYHETNEGCPLFGRHNNYGEPSPIRRRSFDELRRHDEYKVKHGVKGIKCDVRIPQRHMFTSAEAFASARDKFAQLEDLLHSINW